MVATHLQRTLLVRVLCDGSGFFFFSISALGVAGNREHMRCTTREWLDSIRVQTTTICDDAMCMCIFLCVYLKVSFHHFAFHFEFYLLSCLCDQGAEVLKLGVGSELCFSLKM